MCRPRYESLGVIPESHQIAIGSAIWPHWQHVAALREGRVLIFDVPPPGFSR